MRDLFTGNTQSDIDLIIVSPYLLKPIAAYAT